MPNIKVTETGVSKLLLKRKPHEAAGPDRIPNRVPKELAEENAPIITALFNQSLETESYRRIGQMHS